MNVELLFLVVLLSCARASSTIGSCHDVVCAWSEAWLASRGLSVRPTLAAAVMVKDEADAMELTLQSLPLLGIDTVFVYDTGSTDGTQARVRELAQRLGLRLDLFDGVFVDFATSRNVLLARAADRSHWLLLLDAGDVIVPTRAGVSVDAVLRSMEKDVTMCSVQMVQLWDSSVRHVVSRLIRNDGTWRYVQPVHEYLENSKGFDSCTKEALDNIPEAMSFMLWQNRSVSGRSSPARWLRDIEVLKDELQKNPKNGRAAFYLGNTYSGLQMWREAIAAFLYRIELRLGWYEEAEQAMIAMIKALLEVGEVSTANRWSMTLLRVYQRVEGVMALASHALDKQHNAGLCFGYADMACRVLEPRRTLFLDPALYRTFRWNLRKMCWDRMINATRRIADEDGLLQHVNIL